MFGGVKRVSNRLALMTENYLASWKTNDGFTEVKESAGGGLYGLRFIWPRTNLDMAGVYYYENFNDSWGRRDFFFSSYVIPIYFSFTYKFGTRRQVGKIY